MHPFFRKFFGISLVLLAIFGMLFSALGIVGIWTVRTSVIGSLNKTTELFITILETTSNGLLVVDNSLNTASGTITSTVKTSESMAGTLTEINSLANGMIGILNFVGGGIEAPDPQNSSLEADVNLMTANLSRVSTSLDEAQEVVLDYQQTVVLTILLLWLAIAQIALLLQGVEHLRKSRN